VRAKSAATQFSQPDFFSWVNSINPIVSLFHSVYFGMLLKKPNLRILNLADLFSDRDAGDIWPDFGGKQGALNLWSLKGI
jgi:hypothetical protein